VTFFKRKSISGGNYLSVELPVALIEEDGTVIAYTPALDLSTCGGSREEAIKMFREATQVFFNDLVENNTIDEVLTGLGWQRDVERAWVPPRISQESVDVTVSV